MRRILVVDDDPHVRLAIRTWLQHCGFRVAVADGGPNGIDALRPATLPGVIDQCLSEAEPHRKCVATLAAVTGARSEPARQDVGGKRAEHRLRTY